MLLSASLKKEAAPPAEAYNNNIKFIAYVWNDQVDGRIDTIMNLDMTPISDHATVLNQNKSFTIRLTRNILSVNYNANSSDPISEIAIFSINGRKIFSQQCNSCKNVITIDLNKNNVSTG